METFQRIALHTHNDVAVDPAQTLIGVLARDKPIKIQNNGKNNEASRDYQMGVTVLHRLQEVRSHPISTTLSSSASLHCGGCVII